MKENSTSVTYGVYFHKKEGETMDLRVKSD